MPGNNLLGQCTSPVPAANLGLSRIQTAYTTSNTFSATLGCCDIASSLSGSASSDLAWSPELGDNQVVVTQLCCESPCAYTFSSGPQSSTGTAAGANAETGGEVLYSLDGENTTSCLPLPEGATAIVYYNCRGVTEGDSGMAAPNGSCSASADIALTTSLAFRANPDTAACEFQISVEVDCALPCNTNSAGAATCISVLSGHATGTFTSPWIPLSDLLGVHTIDASYSPHCVAYAADWSGSASITVTIS